MCSIEIKRLAALVFLAVLTGCFDPAVSDRPCASDADCLAGRACDPVKKVCVPAGGTSDAGPGADAGEPFDSAQRDGGDEVADAASAPDATDGGGDPGSEDGGVDIGPEDGGVDAGFDAGNGPVIVSIEGTGELSSINPRSEDQPVWNDHASDRVSATRRVSSADKKMVISGLNLGGVTTAELAGKTGQGTHALSILTKTATTVDVGFPATLAAGGMFDFSVSGTDGSSTVQLYLMQGEPGDPGPSVLSCTGNDCTLDKNLTVTGSFTASGSITLPDCPSGYTHDKSRTDITLCKRGLDEMVKVGDFWIDRYEGVIVDEAYWNGGGCDGVGTEYQNYDGASPLLPAATFPHTGDWSVKLYACSKSGVKPTAWLRWFQAQQALAASSKKLCTNEEWQAAVAGTFDPGSYDGASGGPCQTNGGTRKSGLAGDNPEGVDSCISSWGAEDMIGNIGEMVAWWGQAGRDLGVTQGAYAGNYTDNTGFARFSPETSGDGDGTWNLNGEAIGCIRVGSSCAWKTGLPFAAVRGGSPMSEGKAGAFATYLTCSPAGCTGDYTNLVGFRGCRR